MALIKCPECGKKISDKAQTCIRCGYPLRELGIGINQDEQQSGCVMDVLGVDYDFDNDRWVLACKQYNVPVAGNEFAIKDQVSLIGDNDVPVCIAQIASIDALVMKLFQNVLA